ncbi:MULTISPECIES: phosphoribosyl-ATP diphosphatase [Clostridium]|jgi:phosphoribosyl-ATP pyrophosphohydrolase|uniref:Phosphoribosyl-ATP pyrophosphatase n=3 Tax=Clostridium intestinale TaxID=36845 RepID=U2NKS2_9CLOT|nr:MULTISPECIES: phosphoribosyl-ATP diphosphatase [Clostridium]ERK29743.1 phosphoribosyl-ATP pyrophosphatase HisE [Clostridium intestinale URNW]QLY81122.1 phosphoribosyl-ATP diphosphatase [Clostridium intestinale]WRY51889.1 phosphoribosyl-ATP diphosphatase [Clostridium intestinale]SHH91890.1 phosphoribosyl-ATP pyrophosphatase [Clostridium intestinale DSM 6191]
MENVIENLYKIILSRKEEGEEGSYTKYLFDKGLDKILKKVGEEATEVIIAAKGDNKEEQVAEICDLTYHLLVLMAELNIPIEEVSEELNKRAKKIGNLKEERKEIEKL